MPYALTVTLSRPNSFNYYLYVMSDNTFFNQIKHALKQNLIPGIVLQLFAIVIVLSYFYLPQVTAFFAFITQLRQTYGVTFVFLSTALFGGLIPFLYLWLSNSVKSNQSIILVGIFYLGFWGVKGVEVSFFYELQGYLFGYENTLATIAVKTAVDQFIYSALWAVPSISIAYLWMENSFNLKQTQLHINKHLFTKVIPVVVLSNWMVWIPAVSIVYLMPADLQIMLFNLVLCFWVLMLAVLNEKSAEQ